ncbi:hypothetical protein ACWXVO_02150 [Mycoplasma sp. 1890]
MKVTRIGQNYILKVNNINKLSPFFNETNVKLVDFLGEDQPLELIISDNLTFEELGRLILSFYGYNKNPYYPIFDTSEFDEKELREITFETRAQKGLIANVDDFLFKKIEYLDKKSNYFTAILSDFSVVSFEFTLKKGIKYAGVSLAERFSAMLKQNTDAVLKHSLKFNKTNRVENSKNTSVFGMQLAKSLYDNNYVYAFHNSLVPSFGEVSATTEFFDFGLLSRLELSTISKEISSIFEWRSKDKIYQSYFEYIAPSLNDHDLLNMGSIGNFFGSKELSESEHNDVKKIQEILSNPEKYAESEKEMIEKVKNGDLDLPFDTSKIQTRDDLRYAFIESFVEPLIDMGIDETEIVQTLKEFVAQVKQGTFVPGVPAMNITDFEDESFIRTVLEIYREKKSGREKTRDQEQETVDEDEIN